MGGTACTATEGMEEKAQTRGSRVEERSGRQGKGEAFLQVELVRSHAHGHTIEEDPTPRKMFPYPKLCM